MSNELTYTFYTVNETIAHAVLVDSGIHDAWYATLSDTPLSNVPALIEDLYGTSWYGVYIADEVSNDFCAQIVYEWIAWLRVHSKFYAQYLEKQGNISNTVTSLNKYVDTPETALDYSGEEHTTNVTRVEHTDNSNTASLSTLRDYELQLIKQFRTAWLLPEEAL